MKSHKIEQLKKFMQSFHKDEKGANTLEIVMILAIAAMVVAAILFFAKDIKKWASELLNTILGKKEIDG